MWVDEDSSIIVLAQLLSFLLVNIHKGMLNGYELSQNFHRASLPCPTHPAHPHTHLDVTVKLQWLEHLWDYENLFETGVVQANEC